MKEISAMNRGAQRKPAKYRPITSVALAVAIVTSGLSFSAQALVLGQVRVNSYLGEPLRAEIPVSQLTEDEASSLEVGLATPADFSSRGLIYSSILSSIRVSYEMTGGSTAVIKITSSRSVQDPFVDLLMDVRWRAGNQQRSYTMLIDPAGRVAAPVATTRVSVPERTSSTPLTSSAPSNISTVPVQSGATSSHPMIDASSIDRRERIVVDGQAEAPPRATTTNTATPSQPRQERPAPVASSSNMSVKVGRGQTLGSIANSMKPAGVTTEQMLTALYRANPSAFINKNINWVRAGATLNIPSDEEIASVTKADARSLVSSHAREFNNYRRQAAQNVTSGGETQEGSRAGGGQVKPQPKPTHTPTGRDELVIDQGGQTVDEAQKAEDQRRIDEIRRQNAELEALGESVKAAERAAEDAARIAAEERAASIAAEEAELERQRLEIEREQAELEKQELEAGERPGQLVPDEPKVEQPPVIQQEVPAPMPDRAPMEKSMIDELLDNPLLLLAGGGVVLALVGGVIFIRRRKNAAYDDEEFDDEFDDTGADSFFADNPSLQDDSLILDQSSSIYAASQLDTNADVDPIQEADVYLAYGRDEQAAEILREALTTQPDRVQLHAKLCEVYARQNNVSAFDEQASQLRALTAGEGSEWNRVVRLAQNISPDNPIYSDTVETQNLGGFASQFSPSSSMENADTRPLGVLDDSDDDDGFMSNTPDVSLNLDKAPDATLDFTDMGSSDGDAFDMGDSGFGGFDESDEEGPATRLALAEEFFAIGNKKDAKEIVEEVLSQSTSSEVKKRASSLLDKVS